MRFQAKLDENCGNLGQAVSNYCLFRKSPDFPQDKSSCQADFVGLLWPWSILAHCIYIFV